MKTRRAKAKEYEAKYGDIPKDDLERLKLFANNLSKDKKAEILEKRDKILSDVYSKEFVVILYEIPEGAKRPRFRRINRKNLASMAMADTSYIQIYSPNAGSDSKHMKRLMTEDIHELDSLITTPCILKIDSYFPIPSTFSKTEEMLAEAGYIRPLSKPDWDNIGKKYSDMYNDNVWLDDAYVIQGTVNKYYSYLPRVEIRLKYLTKVFTKKQCKSLIANGYKPEYII